ncbi:MAG: F0F1 ATP synthase subunit delta [Actinomycetales bacterium]|nr:F0F1 ATP synthase subunit delta [Actinomycetales bacterium]
MLGASRDSIARQSQALDGRRQQAGFPTLADELYAVADLLGTQMQLRNALADAGQSPQVREALLRDVLGQRISALAVEVLIGVVGERWSSDDDLVMAIERLAAQAAFTVAEADGSLDATEEEIFRFGRALDQSPQLQMALTDPSQAASVKAAIVRDLLAGRSTQATRQVLEHAVGHLHGQRIDAVVDQLGDLAAAQRSRVVAEVRVAAALDAQQERRLADALSSLKGRTVRLNIAVDPAVLGGVYVKVGDEVIDGTVAARLDQARRVILGS